MSGWGGGPIPTYYSPYNEIVGLCFDFMLAGHDTTSSMLALQCNTLLMIEIAYSCKMIQEYELYFRDQSGKIIIDAYKFNVIITTYEVLLSDNSELKSILWRAVIIDEAHRLKNKNCKMLEGLRELHMKPDANKRHGSKL
uniref:SNF2 N-terminal domain-containing protein n=1 Tax=Amphimedon queenslandica TaxID=400682 RepID=A0A1X7TFF7_AMPQE